MGDGTVKPRLVIFDLDGTLLDTSPGIFATAKYTMRRLGLSPDVPEEQMRKFIGPPIAQCFKVVYDLPDQYLDDALAIYKKRYVSDGQYQALVYPGMQMVLKTLKERGYLLAVGTLKNESTAGNMMRHYALAPYFVSIHGDFSTLAGGRTKADVLRLVLSDTHVKPEEAVLVGDTTHDQNGANVAGVGFVPVTYGFGFSRISAPQGSVASPQELLTRFP